MLKLRDFISDETGATAVEYALLGALLVMGLLTAFKAWGDSFTVLYTTISERIGSVN